MPAGTYGSCIHYLGLDICFDKRNYHVSLQSSLQNWELEIATGTQKTLKPVAVGNNVSTNNIEIALLAMLL